MSKLNIDQTSIFSLFSDKRSDFLIPDYQRPYAWTEDECTTLWEDLLNFAIPEGNADNFNTNDEYFLGPIVTFRNDNNQLEIIDGQQRLTTLMLMLRAFYSRFEYPQDSNSKRTRQRIEQCIWKTDEFGGPNRNELKIDSEVASDADKEEFLTILRVGETSKEQKSNYAVAFNYFLQKIDEFIERYPTYMAHLPTRILSNVILLPIEAESQDTALRIFSTLNDRGLPLADADIFKSQFYKYFSAKNLKDEFISRWKELEELTEHTFGSAHKNPMDELFTRYMYFERARLGIKTTTTEGLRDFYEKNSYALLHSEQTLENLESLASFWERVATQQGFSNRVLRRLYVLNYAPNGMWTYITSVYYLHNRDEEDNLDDDSFYDFLSRITAFIWTYAVLQPGVNALRSPMYPEMVRIVNDEATGFENYRFKAENVKDQLRSYFFTNQRPFTKSMLLWWAFEDPDQELLDLDTTLHVEHIFSSRRQKSLPELSDDSFLDAIGNKAFLESRINIRASDYRFEDKKRYYLGQINGPDGHRRPATKNIELVKIARDKEDFTQEDIIARSEKIISAFGDYLAEQGLAD